MSTWRYSDSTRTVVCRDTGDGGMESMFASSLPSDTVVEDYVQTKQEQIAEIERALDAYLDTVARQRRYADRISCALRAGYTGPFQAEGQAFALWMDNCNAKSYSWLAEVNSGTRSLPENPQELIDLLPPMVWPS